jgi:hypothetical protein
MSPGSRGYVAARDPEARKEGDMAACEVCGNDYDKSFEVIADRA